jgi:TolA-binding protein
MPIEQILLWVAGIIGTLLGGGGIWAGVTALSNRKIGIKTTEIEANKNIAVTWDSIVTNLQEQLTYLAGKVEKLEQGQEQLQQQLGAKERLLLRAIAHIGILELLIPEHMRIKRPEGLE